MDRRQFLSLLTAADGVPLINKKRTFPLALYHPPPGHALREVKEAGFDIVHCEPTREALDAAAAAGLYGWCTVGSNRERIAAVVEKLRDHAALLYWETEDEPSFQWKEREPRVSPAVIREAYAYLRQLDPTRLVYLNHSPTNLVSTLQAYNPGGDLIATDVYPVIPHGIRPQYALWPDGRQGDLLNPHLSQVGAYTAKMREVAGPRRTVLMVLQAFAWEMLRDAGDRDPKMVLYPTREQLLFMACHAIVRGANGLKWWGLRFTPADTSLWNDLASVATLLHGMRDELAAPAAATRVQLEYHDTGHSLDRGIEWMARPSLWMAVNADPNPVEATVRGLPAAPEVLAGPRPERDGSAHRLALPPFGVAIWRAARIQ